MLSPATKSLLNLNWLTKEGITFPLKVMSILIISTPLAHLSGPLFLSVYDKLNVLVNFTNWPSVGDSILIAKSVVV